MKIKRRDLINRAAANAPDTSGRESEFREVIDLIRGALFERAVLGRPKVSPAVTLLHPEPDAIFKDSYLVDFLGLPEAHTEHELQTAIIVNLKRFFLELGRDFAFVGEQYLLPVGGQDFRLDLLFYHRDPQSLIAIELEVDEFMPEHLGKLEFYLEALDRDVRKSHENPSIGVLLCTSKDNEVVEYALSRSASPALVAEYQTRLPDRRTLQRKLHEFYQLARPETGTAAKRATRRSTRVPARRRKNYTFHRRGRSQSDYVSLAGNSRRPRR